MDHHCPWLGGRCVGLRNHKYFVIFLMWASITSIICAFGAVEGLSEFVTINANLSEDGFRLAPLNWAFLLLVGALFGMVLTGFGTYHLFLLSVNRCVGVFEMRLPVQPDKWNKMSTRRIDLVSIFFSNSSTTIENMERSLRVRPTLSTDSSSSYALLRSHAGAPNLSFGASSAQPTLPVNEETLPSYELPVYKSDDRLTRAERKKLESGSTRLNVYDLGRADNFREVFGRHSRWWEWPLPIPPKGSVFCPHFGNSSFRGSFWQYWHSPHTGLAMATSTESMTNIFHDCENWQPKCDYCHLIERMNSDSSDHESNVYLCWPHWSRGFCFWTVRPSSSIRWVSSCILWPAGVDVFPLRLMNPHLYLIPLLIHFQWHSREVLELSILIAQTFIGALPLSLNHRVYNIFQPIALTFSSKHIVKHKNKRGLNILCFRNALFFFKCCQREICFYWNTFLFFFCLLI